MNSVSVAILSLASFVCLLPLSSCGLLDNTKVFTYPHNSNIPIKSDEQQQVTTAAAAAAADNSTGKKPPTTMMNEDEEECWQMIKERSNVMFAVQRRVLDELASDLSKLSEDKIKHKLRNAIEEKASKLRNDFDEASKALELESPDSFFEALFNSSETIISMSSLASVKSQDSDGQKLSDELYLTLVRAISRLGRNNAMLIQQFTSLCTIKKLNVLPREIFSQVNKLQ